MELPCIHPRPDLLIASFSLLPACSASHLHGLGRWCNFAASLRRNGLMCAKKAKSFQPEITKRLPRQSLPFLSNCPISISPTHCCSRYFTDFLLHGLFRQWRKENSPEFLLFKVLLGEFLASVSYQRRSVSNYFETALPCERESYKRTPNRYVSLCCFKQ